MITSIHGIIRKFLLRYMAKLSIYHISALQVLIPLLIQTQDQIQDRLKAIIEKVGDNATIPDLFCILGAHQDNDTKQVENHLVCVGVHINLAIVSFRLFFFVYVQEMFLDKFETFLGLASPIMDDSGEGCLTYLEVLIKAIHPHSYAELLSLFNTSHSVRVHSKVTITKALSHIV